MNDRDINTCMTVCMVFQDMPQHGVVGGGEGAASDAPAARVVGATARASAAAQRPATDTHAVGHGHLGAHPPRRQGAAALHYVHGEFGDITRWYCEDGVKETYL